MTEELDKEVAVLQSEMKNINKRLESHGVKLDKLDARFDDLLKVMSEKQLYQDQSNKEKYVTKESFEPVRNIAYGMVGFVLLAVLGALIAGVIPQ